MANGMKFSQAGIDVTKAADHELHFSSDWPTLHVMKGGYVAKSVADGDIFYQHNLGFIPAFIPYVYSASTGLYSIFRAIMAANENNIYYYAPGGGGSGAGRLQLGLFIFNVDITNNYKAPQVNPSLATAAIVPQSAGMRIANDGSNLKSKDMQNYKVDTDARTPLIHAVSYGVGDAIGSTSVLRNYSYTHDLPYNPMFLPYIEHPTHPGQYMSIANFAGVTTAGQTITIHDLAVSQRASIVILKDPFDVSENTLDITI